MRNPLIPTYDIPDTLPYPPIDPVPEDVQRPYWSVMIPTFNRPDYLRETLESILLQALPPEDMQIMVVDNASTVGDIEALVQEVGQGRVEYHRHHENIGLNRNWTSCIQLSRGRYIHMMHDDDLLMPGFYEAYRQHMETYNCDVMFCQSVSVDDEGRWHAMTRRVNVADGVATQPLHILFQYHTFNMNALVASRDLYEQIGGYLPGIHHGCDYEICTRLVEVGQVGFTDRPYVMTRRHGGQDSRKNISQTSMMHDYLYAFQIVVRKHNTPGTRRLVYNGLRDMIYHFSLARLRMRDFKNASYLARWAFRIGPNLPMLAHIITVTYERWLGTPVRWLLSTAGRIKRLLIRPRQASV